MDLGVRLADRYTLEERVASGGMAEVWRAWDEVLARTVAVKLVSATGRRGIAFRRRFRDEARSAAGLTHPRVVTIHDYGETEDGFGARTPYLVMEFLDGETLADRLARGPLPPAEAVRVCAQVAEALAAAHRAGIVHRDVKPANVFLTRDGVKVLDFGIARAMRGEPVFSDPFVWPGPLEPVEPVGAAPYLAPEQLGDHAAEPAADVYALGVVLGESLTGTRDPDAVMPPEVPPRITELWLRCRAADPAERPSAAEVASTLAAGLPADEPTIPLGGCRAAGCPAAAAVSGVAAAGGAGAGDRSSAEPEAVGSAGTGAGATAPEADGVPEPARDLETTRPCEPVDAPDDVPDDTPDDVQDAAVTSGGAGGGPSGGDGRSRSGDPDDPDGSDAGGGRRPPRRTPGPADGPAGPPDGGRGERRSPSPRPAARQRHAPGPGGKAGAPGGRGALRPVASAVGTAGLVLAVSALLIELLVLVGHPQGGADGTAARRTPAVVEPAGPASRPAAEPPAAQDRGGLPGGGRGAAAESGAEMGTRTDAGAGTAGGSAAANDETRPERSGDPAAGSSSADRRSAGGTEAGRDREGGADPAGETMKALTQLASVVRQGHAAGEIRPDVAVDFTNLVTNLRNELITGSTVDVHLRVADLRSKIHTRLREGALTHRYAAVLQDSLPDTAS